MTQTEPCEGVTTELDHALRAFLSQRVRLFGIALRIVGDPSLAEDVVQEAWLRWQRTDRGKIRNPAAFLTTTTTRLAINVVQSARHRHEMPMDAPETARSDLGEDPTFRVEQAVAVEETLRVLTARLSPAELAAYVLRKGFDYPYDEIAHLLRTTATNARQLARRAQQRLEAGADQPVAADLHRRLTDAFLVAVRLGDVSPLADLLAQHAAFTIQRNRRRTCLPSESALPRSA
ncbi:RNA polymerase subunit sigma-24 [Nocardioides sp. NBC_00368]|uniref:sigma factor n=1 Tax=Nocardioides sp. NBC_00368 TaxID=2976000 RepID=UPI002E21C4BC